jgi:hypothetical protein
MRRNLYRRPRVHHAQKPTTPYTAVLRKKYADCQAKGQYNAGDKWDEAVKAYAAKHYGQNPTPEQWVEAAEKATTKCDHCTNGTYYWGASVNGKMTNAAPCYRCQGKGHQNQADYGRNRCYDSHRRVV